MACKAKWRCESCGFCLDCTAGSKCPATGISHRRPEKKKFINRVQRSSKSPERPPSLSRAARNTGWRYHEAQLSMWPSQRGPGSLETEIKLPVGNQFKKES